MSKVFFDHLIALDEVESEIHSISETSEEKEDLWKLVDDIVNHRMMISILDRLPLEFHEDFLSRFHDAPHEESHIAYLNSKIEDDVEEIIKREVGKLKTELLQEIRSLKPQK